LALLIPRKDALMPTTKRASSHTWLGQERSQRSSSTAAHPKGGETTQWAASYFSVLHDREKRRIAWGNISSGALGTAGKKKGTIITAANFQTPFVRNGGKEKSKSAPTYRCWRISGGRKKGAWADRMIFNHSIEGKKGGEKNFTIACLSALRKEGGEKNNFDDKWSLSKVVCFAEREERKPRKR